MSDRKFSIQQDCVKDEYWSMAMNNGKQIPNAQRY